MLLQEQAPDCAFFTIMSDSDTDTASEGEVQAEYQQAGMQDRSADQAEAAHMLMQVESSDTTTEADKADTGTGMAELDEATFQNDLPSPLTRLYGVQYEYLPSADLEKHLDAVMLNLPTMFSPSSCQLLQESTVGQALCTLWFEHRKGRITASHFGQVLKCKTAQSTIVSNIMGYTTTKTTPSLTWGRDNEKHARQAFLTLEGVNHNKLAVKDISLVVHPQNPHLGASPDGIVHCLCCPPSVLEIKCPSKYSNVAITEAVGKKDFCLDENLQLKEDHMYFAQVQGQMALCKLRAAYFVVWTTKQCHIQYNIF